MTWTRRTTGWLLLMVLIIAGSGWFGWQRWSASQRQKSPPITASTKVQKGDLFLDFQATGKVQPLSRIEIKPPIAGRIEEVLVEEGKFIKNGAILAMMSSSDRAAMIDMARARGAEAVRDMEDVFRATPIVAPISGTVIVQNVRRGQTVGMSDVAMILSDYPVIVAEVDETDIAAVHLHQEVQFTLDAYPKMNVPGKVSQIAFESRTVNNVTIYEVKIKPHTIPPEMRSGMTASVRFRKAERRGVTLVPNAFVLYDGGKPYVWVVDDSTESPRPIRREIQVGLTDGRHMEVTSGLEVDETVATLGTDGSPSSDKKGGESKGKNPFMPNFPTRGSKGGGRPAHP